MSIIQKIPAAAMLLAAVTGISLSPLPAIAGSEPFVGEIVCGGFNFAPKGWAIAQGQLLPILQNTALFSLLGTNYGGDGKSTFGLPDLRGRTMINAGQGPGLTPRVQGETGGSETLQLTAANLPPHSHTFAPPASAAPATVVSPVGALPASDPSTKLYTSPASAGAGAMATGVTDVAGSGVPANNMQPYGTLTCIISLFGIFPARP
ncbi:phage tail protein [Undibacterium sp.]|uniref:phage tail protein n=1 Tax=Undibacterium sp. TaxID=1914977 RepID=UPI00374DD973